MLHAFLKVKPKIFLSRHEMTIQDLELFESYSQMRTDYVIQERWPLHESGVDYDEYDSDTDSYYIVAHTSGRVVAGMRMTEVDDLESSLSYKMWQFAEDRQQFEAQIASHSKEIIEMAIHNLWDITRLVSEAAIFSSKDRYARSFSRIGLFKILAAGTVIDTNPETAWVFTTTTKMYRFLERSGFRLTVLASGKISADDEDAALLAVVWPHAMLQELKRTKPQLYGLAVQTARGLAKK